MALEPHQTKAANKNDQEKKQMMAGDKSSPSKKAIIPVAPAKPTDPVKNRIV